MPSKFYRPPTPSKAPLQEQAPSPSSLPSLSATQRNDVLNLVQRLINGGMCVSAFSLARDRNVQYNLGTLRSWAKDKRRDRLAQYRRTYAFLARDHPQTPALPIPTPPPPQAPPPQAPAQPTPIPRRPRFVRVPVSPSKVA